MKEDERVCWKEKSFPYMISYILSFKKVKKMLIREIWATIKYLLGVFQCG